MEVYYSPSFARACRKLSFELQESLAQKLVIFKEDPFDLRLKTHKLQGALKAYYAFSVNQKYRVVFSFKDNHAVFLAAIGHHDVYNRLR